MANVSERMGNIRSVGRELRPEVRRDIMSALRTTWTDIDDRREPKTEWKRGNIYFHALQDTLFAARMARPTNLDMIRRSQACFVKDLDDYVQRFPETEDPEMKELFQTVFDVGTCVFWDQDREFIKGFDRAFWELDEQVIRPWAHPPS